MNDTNEIRLHFLDYWRVIRIRWSICFISFLLVMVSAGVTCSLLPRRYFSKVVMEVKSDETRLGVFENGTPYHSIHDSTLTPTQLAVLQSKEILYPVLDNLKLLDAWSQADGGNRMQQEEGYRKLLSCIKPVAVRGTDLIEVGVLSTNRNEAADIANMVAFVYQKVRRDELIRIREAGLAQLREELVGQRKAVEQAQAEMQKIRKREGFVDPNPEALDAPEASWKALVTDDEKQYNDAKSRYAEMQAQLEQTSKLTPDELMTSITLLGIQDPTISKILPQFQETKSDEARLLNGGLGENHPRVKALRAQKAVFAQQLSEAIVSVRSSLAIKLKVSEANLAVLKAKVLETKSTFNTAAIQSQEYINVKANYLRDKRLVEEAERRLNTQMLEGKMIFNPARVWEKAEPASTHTEPRVAVYMLVASLIGIVCGVVLAFFIEYLDTSVKTLDDVERFLKAPVLAVIPKGINALIKMEGDSPDAEAYRILRTNMEFNSKNPNAKTITLVSGGPGEGKSTTLNNLAVICAKGGYKVLVVDADLRRPSQHTFFDMDNALGLSDVLTGDRKFEEMVKTTSIPNLSFLPSGDLPDDAVGILNSQSMVDLIEMLKSRYDLIFFDSPPILGVSDASILASEVDITILVVQYRRFPRAMLQRVKNAIESVGGYLLGIVLNNVETKHDAGYQYYTQYYDYYTPEAELRRRKTIKQAALTAAAAPAKVADKPGDY